MTVALLGFACGVAACAPIIRLQWRRIRRLGQRIHAQNDAAICQAIAHGEAVIEHELLVGSLRAEIGDCRDELATSAAEVRRLMAENDRLAERERAS